MDASEDGAQLAGHGPAGLIVFGIAKEAAGDGFAVDALHEEEGDAQGVVAHQVNPGDEDAGLGGGLQQSIFELAGHEVGSTARVAAQDEGQGPRVAVIAFDHGVK